MPHLRFRIEYYTNYGEKLCLNYRVNNGAECRLPLCPTASGAWWGEFDVPAFAGVRYAYSVCDEAGCEVRAMRPCSLQVQVGQEGGICLCDQWVEREIPAPYRHSAFTECIFGRGGEKEALSGDYILRTCAVPPPTGCHWAVCGASDRLGAWQPEAALPLRQTGTYEWSVALSREDFEAATEYKYLLITEAKSRPIVLWEEGHNRRLVKDYVIPGETVMQTDDTPRLMPEGWKGAGVVIPVFSLRSRGSQGVGDFGDLAAFVRWAASVGMSTVQLLPINDTTSSGTWRDSYPYNGISVFALHPIYMDLRAWEKSPLFAVYAERATTLNVKAMLDYEAVYRLKMEFLSELFRLEGRKVMGSADYTTFFGENKEWLEPYARYSCEKAQGLSDVPKGTADFYYFVQFLLHRQMLAAHDVARALGVILKGDIPIGVCGDSVPATVDRHLFHFNGQAGAPPDAFARHGQNWGFPTYNWDEMAKDGYRWWRRRLSHMARYFDAYRIDHVLGFFRIWEIPSTQAYGILGRFRPALPLSDEEIANAGFHLPAAHYAVARLSENRLRELADGLAEGNLWDFFERTEEGDYVLREGFRTQREQMERLPDSPLRNALLDAAAEVLFIADPDMGGWHPRIGAQDTALFRTLPGEAQQAFNGLHDNFFYFRHNDYWAQRAMEKLPAVIDARPDDVEASMLPCAEDLGMVPASVKGVLDTLQILSLEIQRMPKTYGVRFSNLNDNPYLSVATIATHDMPPFRLWWHADRQQTQQFYTQVLGCYGEAPEDATPEICEQVVKMHLASPSMLCLIALQDYLAIDGELRNPHYDAEQINDPANAFQYWQYRMHLTIEDLVEATSFNEKLRGLVALTRTY